MFVNFVKFRQKSFNDYFSQEHAKLLSLWRTVVAFRRSFGEMKSSTERDLNRLRTDLTQSTRTMQTACFNLNANIKTGESQGQVNKSLQYLSFVVLYACVKNILNQYLYRFECLLWQNYLL
jgi:hypothetical protein